jgi:2'-5' RNA ligase
MNPEETTVRLFIAIETPQAVRKWLSAVQRSLSAEETASPYRWVGEDNFHITLQFLGETPELRISELERVMQKACAKSAPLRLEPGSYGFFPRASRPRVFWIGIKDERGQASRLQTTLTAELSSGGFPVDTRAFHPHITLAYVRKSTTRRPPPSAFRLTGTSPENVPRFTANRILLVQSTLSPGGSVYRERAAVMLDRPDGGGNSTTR